jgi:hypothetical protein
LRLLRLSMLHSICSEYHIPPSFLLFSFFFDSNLFRVHPGKIRPSVADLHVLLNPNVHPSS